jgi:hypothetical protein
VIERREEWWVRYWGLGGGERTGKKKMGMTRVVEERKVRKGKDRE